MSIIYSYPEQGTLNSGDMLIGTSIEKVGGKQKNVTKNFSIQQIADFINRGAGLIDPVATDFQIPVFNQGGLKITGSIMSQNSSPSNGVAGTIITIAGSQLTTIDSTINRNLSVLGDTTLGVNSTDNVILNGVTSLLGPIKDGANTLGQTNQILISNNAGLLTWNDYSAGLTYQGVWNAFANTPTLTPGTGTNGHFYIVDVAGNTNLDGNIDWQVGDWALFSGVTGAGGFWDKIDNTQSLTGSGTTNTMTMWTSPSAIGDSLISQAGTVVSVNASLKVKDTVEATTANTNLKLKGAGTGGVEIMGDTASATDGRIQLNCYVNTHGVTIQSPPHINSATYTLILPATLTGTAGQVLTSAGEAVGAQLTWSTPTTGTVTSINYTTDFTAFTAGPGTAITTAGVFTLNKNGGTAGQYIDGAAGAWTNLPAGDTYDLGSSTNGANVRLNLDAASGADSFVTLVGGTGITVAQAADVITLTGSAQGVTSVSSVVTAIPGLTLVTTNQNSTPVITLGLDATAGSNKYLDGGSGQWTTLPVTGVTSVTGDSVTIAATAGNTPVISAITAPGVALGNANLATGGQIQSAIDSALSGALIFRGTFNAATGAIDGGSTFLYQVTAGGAFDNSAARVAVAIGDFYIANVAGNFYGTGGTALGIGDEAIAITAYDVNLSQLVGWSVVPAQSSGGTVTGTGAATQVTFWDAASNINGDTAFNWDNTNKRLGIGTNAPASVLHLKSTVNNATQLIFENTNNGSNMDIDFYNNVGAVQSRIRYSESSGGFDFIPNTTTGSSALFISYGGNVGIGTDAPDQKLHVKAATGASAIARIESISDNQNAQIDFKSTVQTVGTFTQWSIGQNITTTAGALEFALTSPGNSAKVVITPFGKVGINVSDPDAQLEIVNSLGGSYRLGFSGTDSYFDSENFYIRSGNGNVNKLIVNTSGNVGIGTTIPAVSLDIAATDAIQIPKGTTAQRAASVFTPAEGMLRYSTTDNGFEGYASGAWGAIGGSGGASATITTRSATTINATTTVFALGATPATTSFVDVFVDGVYQEINTYGVSGTNLTFGTAVPLGVTVETKTTSDYNVGAAVTSVNGLTGAVNLRIVPNFVTAPIAAQANNLYIFDSTTTAYTVTLPGSPSLGDSIKISNRGGLATNVLGANGNNIMGASTNLTINNATAAFEIIWAAGSQGWIIIGNV